jgi:hypothetical protein
VREGRSFVAKEYAFLFRKAPQLGRELPWKWNQSSPSLASILPWLAWRECFLAQPPPLCALDSLLDPCSPFFHQYIGLMSLCTEVAVLLPVYFVTVFTNCS